MGGIYHIYKDSGYNSSTATYIILYYYILHGAASRSRPSDTLSLTVLITLARHNLQRDLGRKAGEIPYLLGEKDGIKEFLRYVHATKRFKG